MRQEDRRGFRRLVLLLAIVLLYPPAARAAEKNLLDLWGEIKAPPPVSVAAVTLNPKTTALLILDIEEWTCNAERRPRCLESVPRIKSLLTAARQHGMAVIYSTTFHGSAKTILPGVQPVGESPVVQSGVDKFFRTDLEQLLAARHIDTVVIVGTAAEGAVLHTATGAAMRGLKVIVPLDTMTSGTLYAEQYTAWHLMNAPGTKGNATLTLCRLINF